MPSAVVRTSSVTSPVPAVTVQVAHGQQSLSTATRARSSASACGRIGAVAALTGKRPSSIRYYEQIGLLPPARRVSGRRVYGPDTVRTLAVIETGQRAGLSLGEIGDLLSASPGDQDAIERLRELAARKLPEITALIARTEIVRGWLESAARCECPSLDECPLFDDPELPGKAPTPR